MDIDAMDVTINVTAKDIKHGQQRNGFTCPLARALRREFPRAEELYVLYKHAYLQLTPSSGYLRASLSDSAAAFVSNFDRRPALVTRPRRFKLKFAPHSE